MNVKFIFAELLGVAIIMTSCRKDEINSKGSSVATLIVTNAVIGGSTVKLNSNDRDSAKMYNAKAFSLPAGENDILLYPTSGSKLSYYTGSPQTANGEIYSVFLSGQNTSVEVLFIRENIPLYYQDSTIGVRVVNLSSNSTPVNVTLASAPSNPIFSNVTYKQITSFTKYPLPGNVSTNSVTFQVRDPVSNNLLTSYVLPLTANATYTNISIANSRNRNITLVIKGLMGVTTGVDAFGIFPVADY